MAESIFDSDFFSPLTVSQYIKDILVSANSSLICNSSCCLVLVKKEDLIITEFKKGPDSIEDGFDIINDSLYLLSLDSSALPLLSARKEKTVSIESLNNNCEIFVNVRFENQPYLADLSRRVRGQKEKKMDDKQWMLKSFTVNKHLFVSIYVWYQLMLREAGHSMETDLLALLPQMINSNLQSFCNLLSQGNSSMFNLTSYAIR